MSQHTRGACTAGNAADWQWLQAYRLGGEAGWKDPTIPRAHHDAAAIAGELVGEILGIADAQDLGRRVMPETPRRKGDRGHQGFEMARRQVDDQSSDLALAHLGQLGGDDLEMPVWRKRRLRVELGKTTLSKKPKSDRRIALYSEGERALIAGSPILVSEARLDALNDFVVGLGEDRRISRAVILRFKLAQHRKHDLSGLKISRGRFVHQLRDDRLALGDLFAPPIRNDGRSTRLGQCSAKSTCFSFRAAGLLGSLTSLSGTGCAEVVCRSRPRNRPSL